MTLGELREVIPDSEEIHVCVENGGYVYTGHHEDMPDTFDGHYVCSVCVIQPTETANLEIYIKELQV